MLAANHIYIASEWLYCSIPLRGIHRGNPSLEFAMLNAMRKNLYARDVSSVVGDILSCLNADLMARSGEQSEM